MSCPLPIVLPSLLVLGLALAEQQASAQGGPSVVVLVRHAEKAASPANDPPLSDAGRLRAEALAEALADARIDAIVITPFERTRSTAAPLAASRGLKPIEVPDQESIEEDIAAAAKTIRSRKPGEAVLVVGHSNTIPAIIAALGGPAMPALCDSEYSNLFVLSLGGTGVRLVRGHFGAPDPANAADCNRGMKVR
ncbi:MAG: phosphoglycerate mutase family protein [Vicinamibacterales bacterium]